MMDVAATCTKSEDESPVVLTAVPEMTWDELTEKQPCSPDVSENPQTKSSSVASENRMQIQKKRKKLKLTNSVPWKEVNPRSKLNSEVDRIQIQNIVSLFTNQSEGASGDAGGTGPLYPKRDSGPLSEDETDDDDDDWLFIPISISDLKFESDNEDQDSPEIHVIDGGETGDQERQCDTNPTHWPSPKPVPASPSQIETFDTLASFMKQALCRSTPEHGLDSEGKPQPTKNRRESVDSCATEDSCDYSSSLGHNYLTASRLRSEPLLIETDDSEGEGNDVTNMPTSPNKSLDKSGMKSLRKTNGQNIPRKDDIIILDSEDESDQNCKKKAETKGRPETMDRRRGTVKEKFKKKRPLPVDSPAPQHQPIHQDTPFEEVTRDACSDPSPSTNRKKISKEESVIITDSESDDDFWISWHCF
ncbi:uncharacterized protein LOC114550131 isoform X2 [Perca flavescens]|nr:uncharacterized protein LOC114550131 isoform X2 [Perca flavescens]XP_028426502.1 uncharacterized protein LOC114550131 isoform X2 [Perca flavescens]XP_028426503.1 uncharacterized protein LOC114550131 isoform X2 [Perca flavescens]